VVADSRLRRCAVPILSLLLVGALFSTPPAALSPLVSLARAGATKAVPFVEVANRNMPPPPEVTAADQVLRAKTTTYLYSKGYVTPQDLWHVYSEPYATDAKLPAPSTSSPVVAVVESGAYAGGVFKDLTIFRKQYGLPACAQGTCYREVNEAGQTSPLPPPDRTPFSGTDGSKLVNDVWWTEADEDVQAVSATCPDCRIIVADATPSEGNAGLVAAAKAAVALGAQYVSMSFGWGATDVPGAAALFATPGVVFTAAPGDGGYSGATLPAAYPNVISTGGLTFTPSADRRSMTFTTWSQTGSGCATTSLPLVSQLLNPLLTAACPHGKASNDISTLANPNTGLATYLSGWWSEAGGTSLAAPLIAGLYAAAGNHTNPGVIYTNAARQPSLFRDVTTGRTGTCPISRLCAAAAGWDAPTGLGTPVSLTALKVAAAVS
jgi:hypothetical protein